MSNEKREENKFHEPLCWIKWTIAGPVPIKVWEHDDTLDNPRVGKTMQEMSFTVSEAREFIAEFLENKAKLIRDMPDETFLDFDMEEEGCLDVHLEGQTIE